MADVENQTEIRIGNGNDSSGKSDDTTTTPGIELIDKLFPKCPPRNNHYIRNTSHRVHGEHKQQNQLTRNRNKIQTNKSSETSNSSESLQVVQPAIESGDGNICNLDTNSSLTTAPIVTHLRNSRSQSSSLNNNSHHLNPILVSGNTSVTSQKNQKRGSKTSHKSPCNLNLLSFSPVKSNCSPIMMNNVNELSGGKLTFGGEMLVNGKNHSSSSSSLVKSNSQIHVGVGDDMQQQTSRGEAGERITRRESIPKEGGGNDVNIQNRIDDILVSPTEERISWTSMKTDKQVLSNHSESNEVQSCSNKTRTGEKEKERSSVHVRSHRRTKNSRIHARNSHHHHQRHNWDKNLDSSNDDSMRDDSSSPSLSLRSSQSHRKGKKSRKNHKSSSSHFKVRSVPVSSDEEDIAIKTVTGDAMDTDMSSNSSPFGQEREIARVIGNVPIALYEGSPRRYGQPKQPGSSMRVFPSAYDDKLESSKVNSDSGPKDDNLDDDFNSTFIDISCDELVKSILSIPLPSAAMAAMSSPEESLPAIANKENDEQVTHSHYHDASERRSGSASDSIQCKHKQGETKREERRSEGHKSDLVSSKSTNEPVERVSSSTMATAGTTCVTSPANSSETLLPTNHENELILLHQRVHQHLLHELTSSVVGEELKNQNSSSQIKEHNSSGHKTLLGPCSKNFTLSPETTDCDSNEVESEYSLSSGSKLVHMPILEDGLSSGFPSSDTECEDSSPQIKDMKLRNGSHEKSSSSSFVPGENSRCARPPNGFTSNNNSSLPHKSSSPVSSCNNITIPATTYLSPKQVSHITISDLLATSNSTNDAGNAALEQSGARNRLGLDVSSGEASGLRFTSDLNRPRMARSRSLQLNDAANPAATEQVKNSPPTNSPHRGDSNDERGTGSQGDEIANKKRGRKGRREDECDTDQETDRLLGAQRGDERPVSDDKASTCVKRKNASREVRRHDPKVLIEGVLFRARYLGSTQLICEGQPTKATRMMQAEEAVSRIKSLAPEGETQPSTEVDLFISTEKIMVLNTDLKEIMMDHSLRTISYIADIGDLLVLMARRRILTPSEEKEIKRIPKMICHVFESEEAQFIAQSIGQAFQVAYMEFLKANGIEDSSFVKEMDYQEVLNSQEIFGDELEMFAKKDRQKEVIVPKQKNEILGMVIVESGWGSMLPTVVIANMAPASPAARCGHLNIGDQIIAINGVSLVGLNLSTCQNYIKSTKNQTAVKLTVVPCAPVVEVKIKRPDTKYQLGFSVQNGVICSLLRGGIAERGGVRVGHRIIEINGQSVVAVPHERIVNLLATSVGEITMKTMPTSMFRLLTGQEAPQYM